MLQSKILSAEAKYRPQYAGLELQDINTYMLGSKAIDPYQTMQRVKTGGGREMNYVEPKKKSGFLGQLAKVGDPFGVTSKLPGSPEYLLSEGDKMMGGGGAGGAGGLLGGESSMFDPLGAQSMIDPMGLIDKASGFKDPLGLHKFKPGTIEYQLAIDKANKGMGVGTTNSTAGLVQRNGKWYTADTYEEMMVEQPGIAAQKGVIDLTSIAAEKAAEIDRKSNAAQRLQDLEMLQTYGGQTTEAMRAADPYSKAIAEAQQKYALSAMESAGQQLSDPNVAMQQQLAKSAYGSAGQASTDANLGLQQQLANQAYSRAGQASTDPIYAAQLKLAQDAYGRTGTLGFEDQRRADQQALLLGQQAGRVGGSGVIAAQMLNRQAAQDQRSLMAQQAGNQAFGMGADLYGRDLQNRQFAQQAGGAAMQFSDMLSQRQSQAAQAAQMAGQQAFGYNRSLGGDPAQILLGRPGSSAGMGSQFFSQAAGLAQGPQGPQLFDPNAGVNLALQNSANKSQFDASIFGAKSAMKGAIIGGALSGIGGAAGGFCWVAREVYGTETPHWMLFREWLYLKAPQWFFNLYARHGEKFALFISNKPKIKNLIRKWMNGRINLAN